MTELIRRTNETQIRLVLSRGAVRAEVQTGERFLDHMLVTFARYAGLELAIEAQGDLKHHLIEDVAIVLGAALREMLPETVARYGDRTVPMDDALVQVSLDLGGRAYYEGPLPSSYYEHFMQSFATQAAATLHIRVHRGRDRHHVVEAAFKALGLAVRDALVETGAVFSTKGAVALTKREARATAPRATPAGPTPALDAGQSPRAHNGNREPVVVTGSPRAAAADSKAGTEETA